MLLFVAVVIASPLCDVANISNGHFLARLNKTVVPKMCSGVLRISSEEL
jgi:hypothetical protein